jgi:hypothetical protein
VPWGNESMQNEKDPQFPLWSHTKRITLYKKIQDTSWILLCIRCAMYARQWYGKPADILCTLGIDEVLIYISHSVMLKFWQQVNCKIFHKQWNGISTHSSHTFWGFRSVHRAAQCTSGSMKEMPPIFFSENVTVITIKFTSITHTSFAVMRPFSTKSPSFSTHFSNVEWDAV